MAATVVCIEPIPPVHLNLGRCYSTDEAEDTWLGDNNGLDSVRSNISSISNISNTDFSDVAEALSKDFANNVNEIDGDANPTDDANWFKTVADDLDIISDSEVTASGNFEDNSLPSFEHPFDRQWDELMPEMDDVEDEAKNADENTPDTKRSRKANVTLSFKSEEKPKQMPDKLLQEARKSTRSRKTKETTNTGEKKKKAPRRRKPKGESKTKKKPGPADPTTAKRKREERLRRNRESANRSRIRKKKEMQELKENVVTLKQKVTTLTERIEELEENNQELREQLAMYKKPQNSFKPAVTVFALVFTVAFFAQPSAVPQVGLAQLPGQGASKVMSGLGRIGQGSKTFLLAPIIDMFSNSALDAALSAPGLTTIVGIVSRLFIAAVLASFCALCFHYFGIYQRSKKRYAKSDVSPEFAPSELILESV